MMYSSPGPSCAVTNVAGGNCGPDAPDVQPESATAVRLTLKKSFEVATKRITIPHFTKAYLASIRVNGGKTRQS